jgi:hypothetical protein
MKIRLEIGEIVLHGYDVADVAGLDRVIGTELTRLLSHSDGMGRRSTAAMKNIELKTTEGGHPQHHHSSSTTQGRRGLQSLGTSIAKSIYKNLEIKGKQR